jgi:hypothetical protein
MVVVVMMMMMIMNSDTKGNNLKLKENRSLKVAVQGPDFMAHSLYIHTHTYMHAYIHTYIHKGNNMHIAPTKNELKFVQRHVSRKL